LTSRLVTWFAEGGPSGDRELIAYAAGSLIGIALATAFLAFVVGASLVGG
jgi:hypothetical protein